MNTKRLVTTLALSLIATSCETPISDPLSALNDLVKPMGYIGWQNPLKNTTTGTMVGGRPSAVSFVAPASDCFGEEVRRYEDFSEYSTVKTYNFQGSLGFLLAGNPILSAGLGLNKSVFVQVELSGLTTEYMSSIDVTDWYQNGMSSTCKQYLNDVGFVMQALKADKLKITFAKKSGVAINLDADNISQYIGIAVGVDWSIQDNTTIVINTPKYIGYQLGRLRLDDEGRSLWRAMTTKDDKYVFERIALFDAPIEEVPAKSMVKSAQKTDAYSIYK
jgi:hypothetical protein